MLKEQSILEIVVGMKKDKIKKIIAIDLDIFLKN